MMIAFALLTENDLAFEDGKFIASNFTRFDELLAV
jgi:hypothetical protein